ncbi:hypothetical protein Saso_32110 [Streptomyces asoensis]|uniref:Uncharacterized protein n=1 Tax=Streptomyces asoensis TaxID=249586 RepID=A0ABQ3S0G5_9ACTN|nr:hypothetical protein GCM10010496_25440 [Streptomyces asoensis]GHI61561.1 hypothetical protein Saso_32110 [Streptomyces asoensis]
MRTVMPASAASSSVRYSRLSVTGEAYVVPPVTFPLPALPIGTELLYAPIAPVFTGIVSPQSRTHG